MRGTRNLLLVLLLLLGGVATALPALAESSRISLALDPQHVQLRPGHTTNVALEITNDHDTIHNYSVAIDASTAPMGWTFVLLANSTSSVLPTQTTTVALVVRLAPGTALGTNGQVTLWANESGSDQNESILLQLSVAALHLPLLDASAVGVDGMVNMAPGQTLDIPITIENGGNDADTYILTVDEAPDIQAWLDAWLAYRNETNGSNDTNSTPPPPVPTGNEAIVLTHPADNSTWNRSATPTIDLNWSAAGLADNLTYTVRLTIRPANASAEVHIFEVNVTGGTANGTRVGNLSVDDDHTILVELLHNSSIPLADHSVRICVHAGVGCGANGSGDGSNGSGSTQGWEVRWLVPLVENVSVGGTVQRLLRVTVPSGLAPTYQGLTLVASSVGGNLSVSSTLVINVTAHREVAFTVDGGGASGWVPGQNEVLPVTVTNLGTVTVHHTFVVVGIVGPCLAAFTSPQGPIIPPGGSTDLGLNVTVLSSAARDDSCRVSIEAVDRDATSVVHTGRVVVIVGVARGLMLAGPTRPPTLVPGVASTVRLSIQNTGTEADDVRIVSNTSWLTLGAPPGWVSVARGASALIEVELTAPIERWLLGDQTLQLVAKSRSSSAVGVLDLPVVIEPYVQVDVEGPALDRVEVVPNGSVAFKVTLTNVGNTELPFTIGFATPPPGLTPAVVSNDTAEPLALDEARTVSFQLAASLQVTAGRHMVDVQVGAANGSGWSTTYPLAVDVLALPGLDLWTARDAVVIGRNDAAEITLSIQNRGVRDDSVSLSTSGAASYDVILSRATVSLGALANAAVTLSIEANRITSDDEMLMVAARSTLEPQVVITRTLTLRPQRAGVDVTVASNVTRTAAPGGEIVGWAWITNLGNVADSITVSADDTVCSVTPSQFSLQPLESSSGVMLQCTVPASAALGPWSLTLTARSGVDPGISADVMINVSIGSSLGLGEAPVSLKVSETELVLAQQGQSSVLITVTNHANEGVTGQLIATGGGLEQVQVNWIPAGGAFTIGPRGQVTHEASLTMLAPSASLELTFAAKSLQGEAGSSWADVTAEPLTLATPPSEETDSLLAAGIDLLDRYAIWGFLAGWGLALLLFLVVWGQRRSRARQRPTPRPTGLIDDRPPAPLPSLAAPVAMPSTVAEAVHEVARRSDGAVTCPECATQLRPRSTKAPPFRLRCPECEHMLRVTE